LREFRPSGQRECEPEVLDDAKKTGRKLHAQGNVSAWAERHPVVHPGGGVQVFVDSQYEV